MSTVYTLERQQWVPRPLQEVFAFFADAGNLEELTPPWLRFEILTPRPIAIAPGTKIDYRLRWHGLPLRWTTEITQWNPPHSFEDVELAGPYQTWHHTHRFEERKGGTELTDIVRYSLPFGLLGQLAHAINVKRDVEKIFDYRREKIQALMSGQRCRSEPQ